MDLTTTYLGLTLPHPLVVGASPLTRYLDEVRKAEDAGAAAVVMHSLFEERLSFPEASVDSQRDRFNDPESYLKQISKLKAAVNLPIIASLNGTSDQSWLDFAGLLKDAGADALEVNIYEVVTDKDATSKDVETKAIYMARDVKSRTTLPVAIKLSQFYTALPHLAAELESAGADGLVLFNRFYQPDFDLEVMSASHALQYSEPGELNLRLRWLAILRDQVQLSLIATGGIHSGQDALKAVFAGADGVQVVSEVLKGGAERIGQIRSEMSHWLERNGYDSLGQAKGRMSLSRCPNRAALERASYIRILESH